MWAFFVFVFAGERESAVEVKRSEDNGMEDAKTLCVSVRLNYSLSGEKKEF